MYSRVRMSATLRDQLDPLTHLPDEGQVGVHPAAHQLTRAILTRARDRPELGRYSWSGIAASALYVSDVAVRGPDRVHQKHVAERVGTSTYPVRDHMQRVARVALEDVDLATHDRVDTDRLRHVAETGEARTLVPSW